MTDADINAQPSVRCARELSRRFFHDPTPSPGATCRPETIYDALAQVGDSEVFNDFKFTVPVPQPQEATPCHPASDLFA